MAALILAVSGVLLSEGYRLFHYLWRINLQSPAFVPGGLGAACWIKGQTASSTDDLHCLIGLFLAQTSILMLLSLQPLETFCGYMKWIISLPLCSFSSIQFSWFYQAIITHNNEPTFLASDKLFLPYSLQFPLSS